MRRLLIRLPLHRLRPNLRGALLYLFGLPPVAGAEDPPGGGGGGDDKRFTQAEVDRIVSERLARDRRERPSDDQVGEWKEKAERYDEMASAAQSDLEREKQAREKAEQERDQAKQAAEEAAASAQKTTRRSAVVAAAAKAGAIDPDEVHALLADKDFAVSKEVDGTTQELKVTIGDDGQVTGAEDVVSALLEQRKHLVGEPRRPDWDGGSRNPPPSEDDPAQLDDPAEVREWAAKQRR